MTLPRSFFATRPRLRRSLGVSFFSAFVALFSPSFLLLFANDAAPSVASSPSNETDASSRSVSAPDSSFRFWMAPADKIDAWPWGDEKYYPIRVETFDDWLRATSETDANRADDSSRSVVSSLFLDAKFDGAALEGTGTFELSFVGGAPDSSATPLPPFAAAASSFVKLPNGEPALSDAATASPQGAKAFVALYPDSRLYLSNPENGVYSFRWSRRGSVDASGSVAFDLVLPPSPRTEMRLETPSDALVSISNGVVEPLETPAPPEPVDSNVFLGLEDAETVSRLLETSKNAASTRTWRVFLGGESQTRLTIARSSTLDARRQIGYRQETSRRLSLEGVESVSRFAFDRSALPLDDATLVLDAPLVPVSLDWNGEKIDVASLSRTNDGQTTRLRLRAPARRDSETLGELTV
ncbi:MAG: hypothetical protein IIW01_09920, partial [Thermoguttaceae bacterium]|nr:hypothetical protein [Thermoguttaceae bacterium]